MQHRLSDEQKIGKIKSILEDSLNEEATTTAIVCMVKKIAAVVYDITDDELNTIQQ